MEKTKEALRILTTGEMNAVKTYEAFSNKAYEEGYPNVGLLFKALSKAERIHIKNHLHALEEEFSPELDDVQSASTRENLIAAIQGESEEGKKLYPKLMKYIKSECKTEYGKVARLSMQWALKVEKEHARILKKALKSIKSGNDFSSDRIFLCQVCGNLVLDESPGKGCDVCGHDVQFFNQISGEK